MQNKGEKPKFSAADCLYLETKKATFRLPLSLFY